MTTDWVPCEAYGDTRTALAGDQVSIPLIDPTYLGNPDEAVGRPDEERAYKVVRIVGYFQLAGTLSGAEVAMRIWRGYVRQLGGGLVQTNLPGEILGGTPIDQAMVANQGFWWERRFSSNAITNNLYDWCDPFSHPWSLMVDIRPGLWMRQMDVPVWSVHNGDAVGSLRVRHYFRMLVTS